MNNSNKVFWPSTLAVQVWMAFLFIPVFLYTKKTRENFFRFIYDLHCTFASLCSSLYNKMYKGGMCYEKDPYLFK